MAKLKQSDVFEATLEKGAPQYAIGTVIIEIEGKYFDLDTLAASIAQTDAIRGFSRSVALEGLEFLAKYEKKSAKKEEEEEENRRAEEERLKAQSEVIDPLLALGPVAEILTGLSTIGPDVLRAGDVRIVFKSGKISFDVETKADLSSFGESLNQTSLSLEYVPAKCGAGDEATGAGAYWKPTIKSSGTRAKRRPIFEDGAYCFISGKGRDAGAGDDFRFYIYEGKVYAPVGTGPDAEMKYFPYETFILDYTVETGNPENKNRPFSHPAKKLQSISARKGDLTEYMLEKIKTVLNTDEAEEEETEETEETE